MKNYFTPGKMSEYPDSIKLLPFCCWKMEKVGNRVTKVPYSPKTGRKAGVDDPSAFGTITEVIKAYKTGQYAGIGVNISGSIGCIDVDHCINGDALSDLAVEALNALPSAFAEISPSGTGLHLFFTVPSGLTFDRETYFINNRKNGVEIYLPGTTKHFMTLTGDIYRKGSMDVTESQIAAFLDSFMKRPNIQRNAETSAIPDGGSILSDAEIIQKLSSEKDGQRFMALYRGDWQDAKPEGVTEWSASEADMSLCSKLAFYCRGDMEQMDRIFRDTGLMRDKWDQKRGVETYGEMTLKNAVEHCSAFYEPQAQSSASEDFTVIDHAAIIDDLLGSDITVEAILSEDALIAAAWAYKNDTLRYTRLRQAVPKTVGIRNYERAVKQHMGQVSQDDESGNSHVELLALSGISTPGMLVPPGWTVDDSGIFYLGAWVSADPLFISGKMENVDDGYEKLEITFRRNSRYKTLIAPRSDMLNKNSIIRYADSGLPVSSGNAALLTSYISAFESTNDRAIPLKRCIRRAGWVGNVTKDSVEFFPYHLHTPMIGQEDDENAEHFLEHLKTAGSEDAWMEMAVKVRTMPFARSVLAASFASVLLHPLQHRNIYYHAWCDSKSGKTAALKFAMSVWGDPAALVKSYFATMVGMEHRAGTMKHLPLALDELQTLDKRVDVNNMIYTLGNGIGKTRGRAGGGIRAIDDWHNCILSTGEMPLSSDNSMDGINTRLMEINACPVDDEDMAAEMHRVSERNFGYAGKKYIKWLIDNVLADCSGEGLEKANHGTTRLTADYNLIRTSLDVYCSDRDVKADNIAVIALADYYASLSAFGMNENTAFGESIELGAALMSVQKQEDHTDTVDRAWNFVTGWVAANRSRFSSNNVRPLETFGAIEKDHVYVICTVLNNALEEAGYSYRKCIRGFGNRGYIAMIRDSTGKNRSQVLKKIDGVTTRVYDLPISIADRHHNKVALSD